MSLQYTPRFPVDSIIVRERLREDLGDLGTLAKSIKEDGLLQPPVVLADGTLVLGARRLEAVKLLGWQFVDVLMGRDDTDVVEALRMEIAENVERKDFTPYEAIRATEQYRLVVESAASERRQAGIPSTQNGYGHGETADVLGALVGMSGDTYRKARAVVLAADEDTERYGDLAEQLHTNGKVDTVHRKLVERKRQAELTEIAQAGQTAGEVEGVTLYCGAFFPILRDFAPASVDVIVTAPPMRSEYQFTLEDLAKRAASVLKPGGSMLLMVRQDFVGQTIQQASLFLRYHWLIAMSQYTQDFHEPVYEKRVQSHWHSVVWLTNGPYRGEWVSDRIGGISDLLSRYTQPGDVVLDPFMGQPCTVGVACRALGRLFVGIDADQRHVDIARGLLGA